MVRINAGMYIYAHPHPHSTLTPHPLTADYQTITVNDSLLRNTTAEVSSDAAFHVEFGYADFDIYFHYIQVSLYPSPASDLSNSSCTCELGTRLSLCHCENCSFTVDFQSLVANRAFDSLLSTVTIGNVSLNDSGTIVSFSYLRGGEQHNEIQWQSNATLTVTPLSSNTSESSDEGFPIITLVSILASLLVTAIATAIILVVCIVWYYKKRKMCSRSSSGINYSELKYSETSE